MRQLLTGILVAALAISGFAAQAQPKPLKAWDFEQDVEGWLTPDGQATLTQCTDAGQVHNGAGSLQLSFAPRVAAEGEIPGAMFVACEGLEGAECWHLALKSSSAGLLMLMIREQDESMYVHLVYLPAGRWQVLDIPLADFQLEESSKDENGVLDSGQIGGLGLVDPSQWFLQAAQGADFPFYFTVPSRRDVWVDEVRLLGEAGRTLRPARGPGGAEAVMVEDCEGDVAHWALLGGRNLKVSQDTDQAAEGASLRLDYELPARTVLAAVRQVASGLLSGSRSIVFSARSGADCKLAVVAEETDKSRYSTIVDVPAGGWQQFTVLLRDLRLEDDSEDPDEGLQTDRVRSVQFLDANALLAEKDMANTLWLDEIMAVK